MKCACGVELSFRQYNNFGECWDCKRKNDIFRQEMSKEHYESGLSRCKKHDRFRTSDEGICWECEKEEDDEKKNKKKGCFITTATLQHKGVFDDNCFELQEFRRLRDTYVQKKHPEYVTEYYQIAPKIVEKINKLEDNAEQFSNIWNDYLKDCLSKTVENNLEDATKIYKNMVDDLKVKFIDTENQEITNFKCLECGSTNPKICKGGFNNCPYS